MKKIDTLLIRSFIAPFFVTFLIALFVLIMQFLWVYIDEIIGKGASILIISELIFYLSISLFPMALPIAILISSVMVMGNLAERYELASFKSAGVSLTRIMQPLAFLAFGIGIFSFVCSNNLIPITNLQFKSRLYDIRKSKPTLSLEQGVFNDDFQGFTIYIKEKDEDGRNISDVLIYDLNTTDGTINQIAAKRGEMYTTPDQRYFIMNLFDGTQSQEMKRRTEKGKRNYSFVRTNFKEYKKVFDLQEFDLKETNTDLFKSHQTMLNTSQLQAAADSIDVKIDTRLGKLEKHFIQFLHYEKKRDTVYFKKRAPVLKKVNDKVLNKKPKSPTEKNQKIDLVEATKNTAAIAKKPMTNQKIKKPESSPKSNPIKKKSSAKNRYISKNVLPQKIDKDIQDYDSFIELFEAKEQKKIFQKSLTTVRSVKSQAKGTLTSIKRERELQVKHIYEKHLKFAMAAVCFIFLFIGAPMGAMMQKGGFGYPILISILFFTLYIMLTIAFEKLAESLTVPAVLGAWLPCMILAPLGAFLTYKALQDAKVANLQFILNKFKVLAKFLGVKQSES